MLSQIQLSSATPDVHSIRHPWVEISITRALTRLLLPSRIMALSRSARRCARLRSGWVSAVSGMRVCSRPICATLEVNKWFSRRRSMVLEELHGAFVLLGRGAAREGAEILPLSVLSRLARIEAVLA